MISKALQHINRTKTTAYFTALYSLNDLLNTKGEIV